MKFTSILLTATALSTPLLAEDFRTGAPVVSAEIYPHAGYVVRRARLDMPEGRHRILIPYDNSTGTLPEFRVTGGLAITSVSEHRGALTEARAFYSPEQAALRGALDALLDERAAFEQRRAAIRARIDAAEARRDFVAAIRPPTESGMGVDELMATAAFVQAANAEIAAEITAAQADMRETENEAEDLAARVATAEAALARAGLPRSGGDLLVLDVTKSGDGPAALDIRALTTDLGWHFTYDLELVRGDAPELRLDRMVVLRQDTGFAWNGVNVSLETADLSRPTEPSKVWPNQASIYDPEMIARSQKTRSSDAFEGAMMDMEMAPLAEFSPAAPFESGQMQVQGLAVSYAFSRPVTLASGDEATLALDTLTFEANEFVQASPRHDTTAYLMAEFTNDSGAPILSSGATFTRDGQLVGGGQLSQIAPGETVTLGFGPYDGILTSVNFDRTDTGDRGVIRSRETRAEVVTFTVENLTGEPQEVRTVYALPFSQQEDLVVETTPSLPWDEIDEDGRRNVAVWNLSLAPGEKREVRLEMDLNWPQGQVLNWQP